MLNKSSQSSTVKKSAWDPRVPATLVCQPYVASQIRHKTKENFGTEDKKVLQGIGLNSLFWHCRRSRSAVDKTTLMIPLWHEVKENQKFLNKTVSSNESSLLWNLGYGAWILTQVNFSYKSQNSNFDFYSPLSSFTPMMLLNTIYSFLFELPCSISFSSTIYQLILLLHSTYIYIFLCLVATTPSAGNADNYNLM